jgi:FtsP/CotA-like multicopper oxidase with cupredoxin domain
LTQKFKTSLSLSLLRKKKKNNNNKEEIRSKHSQILIENKMRGFVLALYSVLFLHSSTVHATTAACVTNVTGVVVLNDCPMNTYKVSETETLNMTWENVSVSLPGVNLVMQAYRMNVLPTRIPFGVITIPKGVNMRVMLRNGFAPNPINLHTHGLHIRGGQNSDGTSSDDVSIEMQSGTGVRLYKYEIPPDHAGGIHWMHAHVHMWTEAEVTGGAFGVLLVEDDPNGLEIPIEVLNAETFVLVFAYVDFSRMRTARFSMVSMSPSNFSTNSYLTNGFPNPTLNIKQGKWTRLRTLHVSPNAIVNLQYLLAVGSCDLVLIAKDGIYLPNGPRILGQSVTTNVYYTSASRVDLLIRCNGAVNTVIQVAAISPALNVFKIKIVSRDVDSSADTWFPIFTPCLPDYLQDTTSLSSDQVQTPFSITFSSTNKINGQSFVDFTPTFSMRDMIVGSVEEFAITGTHPLHIHVNPFQLQQDGLNGWHKAGDWIDVLVGLTTVQRVRTRIDQYLGMVVVHVSCFSKNKYSD